MTTQEWDELNALRKAISLNPASVAPEDQERFTQLLVRSWDYLVPVSEVAHESPVGPQRVL